MLDFCFSSSSLVDLYIYAVLLVVVVVIVVVVIVAVGCMSAFVEMFALEKVPKILTLLHTFFLSLMMSILSLMLWL